jgi:hypothetical protein
VFDLLQRTVLGYVFRTQRRTLNESDLLYMAHAILLGIGTRVSTRLEPDGKGCVSLIVSRLDGIIVESGYISTDDDIRVEKSMCPPMLFDIDCP